MIRTAFIYVALLCLFGAGIYAILQIGSDLRPNGLDQDTTTVIPKQPATDQSIGEHIQHPISNLLLQVVVIVSIARLFGHLFRKIGQPSVSGEIVAGILLGPSFLGLIFPAAEAVLFPKASLAALLLLSQIGVILFMFVVGMELDLGHVREKAHAVVLVSHTSIIVPFFLGVTLSLLIYRSLAPPSISFTAFALFMGIAMSITAFPVLARIIEERGLSQSHLGSTAIACAAVDDATAWCLLAMVVAIVKAAGLSQAMTTIGLSVLFIILMLFVIKPLVQKRIPNMNYSNPGAVALVLVFVFASALATELIGIHALFGAFVAGVILSREAGFRTYLKERIETFGSAFLLPLFFAFTGLRTQIGLLNDIWSWVVTLGIIAIAIAGKLGAGMFAARWTGMSWHDSFAIGALMNTRGLMELVALNIGYELGILGPRIFAMMVLMALVTTFITGPLLALVELRKRKQTPAAREVTMIK